MGLGGSGRIGVEEMDLKLRKHNMQFFTQFVKSNTVEDLLDMYFYSALLLTIPLL